MTEFSLNKTAVLFISFCTIISCPSAHQKEYKKAKQILHRGNLILAKKYLIKSLEKARNASEKYKVYMELAELTHFKTMDYKEAIYFYEKAILHSKNEKQVILPYERQAFIYNNSLAQYEKAIVKYRQLLDISHLPKDKKINHHIQLVQLYYNTNKFFQAELESKHILKQDISPQQTFEVHFLLGNIFLARDKVPKAIRKYKMILEKYPQEFLEHKIYYNLALSYEEGKNFDKALDLLKRFFPKIKKEDKAYVKNRIQRLQKRKLNSPGFRIDSKIQL